MLAAAALAAAACSSVVSESDDPWTASYVDNADRVWTAIHRTLDALGYEVEDEDRGDGTIRAAGLAEPSYRSVVLHIEEIEKAELVRVVVRPSGGSTGFPDDHRRLDEAVREFLTALDEHLGRRPDR
jgi:lipoate-protein ligase A